MVDTPKKRPAQLDAGPEVGLGPQPEPELAEALADNEFVVAIEPALRGDSVARLGADPARVTQSNLPSNALGIFIKKQNLENKTLGMGLLEERLEARPEFVQGDVVILTRAGQPFRDQGATVAHEFFHRGMQMLRDRGLVGPGSGTLVSSGINFDEEDLARVMDIVTDRDTKGVERYFRAKHKVSLETLLKVLSTSKMAQFMANLSAQAQKVSRERN